MHAIFLSLQEEEERNLHGWGYGDAQYVTSTCPCGLNVGKLIAAWSGAFNVANVVQRKSCVLELPKSVETHNQFPKKKINS